MSLSGGSAVLSGLRDGLHGSRLVRWGRRLGERLNAASERSAALAGFDAVATTLSRWVRGSWLYGWLTAEPDPEVIVIDLRETYTVGPVIALIDRLAAWVGPRWRASGPRRALTRLAARTERVLSNSRAVAVLSRLLVPPDLEDRDRRR